MLFRAHYGKTSRNSIAAGSTHVVIAAQAATIVRWFGDTAMASKGMLAALHLPDDLPPQERYLFKPLTGSSHHWALGTLQGRMAGKRLLDIGAGGGGMGATLAPEGPAELVAVDVDEDARQALRGIYGEVYDSIVPLQDRQFDVILLLDVLEHMAEPFEFLRSLAPNIAPGGEVLISVPNIAHWSVRLPLLFGWFEYTSRGLLDRTHLQHFTRRRFVSLLEQVPGCKITILSASIEPIELVLPKSITDSGVVEALAPARKMVAQTLPGLMAYQHLGVLKRI